MSRYNEVMSGDGKQYYCYNGHYGYTDEKAWIACGSAGFSTRGDDHYNWMIKAIPE